MDKILRIAIIYVAIFVAYSSWGMAYHSHQSNGHMARWVAAGISFSQLVPEDRRHQVDRKLKELIADGAQKQVSIRHATHDPLLVAFVATLLAGLVLYVIGYPIVREDLKEWRARAAIKRTARQLP